MMQNILPEKQARHVSGGEWQAEAYEWRAEGEWPPPRLVGGKTPLYPLPFLLLLRHILIAQSQSICHRPLLPPLPPFLRPACQFPHRPQLSQGLVPDVHQPTQQARDPQAPPPHHFPSTITQRLAIPLQRLSKQPFRRAGVGL